MLDQPVVAVLRVSGPNSAALHLLVQTRLGLCSPAFSFSIFHFSSLFSFVFSPGARTNFSCGFRGLLLSSYPLPPRFPKAHPSIHQCPSLFNGTSCISLHNWLVNLRSAHSNTNGVILNYFSFSVSYYYHSCIIIVIIIIMMIILVLLLSSLLDSPAHFHLPPLPSLLLSLTPRALRILLLIPSYSIFPLFALIPFPPFPLRLSLS